MAILFHCLKYYSTIKNYYVVVQKEVADGILKGRTSLGFRTRHCFEVKKLDTLRKGSFNPRPKVDSTFLYLKRKEGIDFNYLDFLRGLKSPRKKLKSNFLGSSEEYCNKRLGELSDQEAYKFYKSSVGLEV
jgi:16S rRNA A1518/A1519 N6-dimethyltransferase RsmA/KsgA/DIM1 with predicted DNA glycosylase/AP lyase activity